jgi:hypothetical protein
MTATQLTARQKDLLHLSYDVYRRASGALERAKEGERRDRIAAANGARQQLIDLMFVMGVGDLADVFDRDELDSMMD